LTRRRTIVLMLYLVIVVYCLLDSYHTFQLFRLGAKELNPLLRRLMEISGTEGVIVWVKVFWLAVLGAGLMIWEKRSWK